MNYDLYVMSWSMSTSNYWVEKSKLEHNVCTNTIPSFCSKKMSKPEYLLLKTERCRRYSKLIIAQRKNRSNWSTAQSIRSFTWINKIRIPFLPLKKALLLCYPFQVRISRSEILLHFYLATVCFLILWLELCFLRTN